MIFHDPAKNGKRIKWTILNLSGALTTREKVRSFFNNFVYAAERSGLELGSVEDAMLAFKTVSIKLNYFRKI